MPSTPTTSGADLPEESAPNGPALHVETEPLRVSARVARLVRKLLDRLPGGRFTRNVTVLAGGTALGHAMTIVAAPLLTRLYSPGDFGVLGVFISLFGIFPVVATLRYDLAIPLPKKAEEGAALVVLSLASVAVVTVLVSALLFLFQAELFRWINAPFLTPYCWLLPIGILLSGIYQVLSRWAVRKKEFGVIAHTRLAQGIGSVATQLLLFSFGPLGLILGRIVGCSTGIRRLTASIWKDDRVEFLSLSRSIVGRVAYRYRRFPQLWAFGGLANSLTMQLPYILLAAFFGPHVLGQIFLVRQILGGPMQMLGDACGNVFLGHGADALHSSKTDLRRLFLKVNLRLLVIGLVPSLAIWVFGPVLFEYVFGAAWDTAGSHARFLVVMFLAKFVAVPLSNTLTLRESYWPVFAWEVLRAPFIILSLVIAYLLGADERTAIIVYSGAMTLGYIVLYGLSYMSIGRVHSDS
jgi:O-antigen/teichoic acid export membrane protein